MLANWSMILNAFLLLVVVYSIAKMILAKRRQDYILPMQASAAPLNIAPADDIIAVRKIQMEEVPERPKLKINPRTASYAKHLEEQPSLFSSEDFSEELPQEKVETAKPQMTASTGFGYTAAPSLNAAKPNLQKDAWIEKKIAQGPAYGAEPKPAPEKTMAANSTLLFFLLAKENRQFAGYEMLQTILAAGLRFGDGNLFHRHQSTNGQGPVLCSLAAATATGVFDLQNIGAFTVRGLCLYMQTSGNPTIDAERFSIMLETGKQLAEGLDALLLDDRKQPLCEKSLQTYQHQLNLEAYEPA